jgi:hypothetical protein
LPGADVGSVPDQVGNRALGSVMGRGLAHGGAHAFTARMLQAIISWAA